MLMVFSRIINKGTGPTRLFIGGVHGKEGLTTIKALKKISEHPINDGKLILFNCPTSKYMSTLNKEYYNTKTGKKILSLINKYKPDIYLELHCYRKESYSELTNKDRRLKNGVPPLIELKEKILIGSISPLIRLTFFEKYDFAFVLEIPCNPSEKSMHTYIEVLDMLIQSRDRYEILDKLESKYPTAVENAREYFLEFSDNSALLFKEIQDLIKESHSKDSIGIISQDPEELKNIMTKIMEKASQKNLNITSKQAELLLQSALIYQENNPNQELKNSWWE